MSRRHRRSLSSDSTDRVLNEVSEQDLSSDVLTAAALDEIRQLKHPPMPVRRVLEVVHLVLHSQRHYRGIPRDGVKWESVLRTLAADDLVQKMETFDIAQLRRSPALARDIHDMYFDPAVGNLDGKHEALSPARVRRASATAATLFSWAARTVELATAEPPPGQAASAVAEAVARVAQAVETEVQPLASSPQAGETGRSLGRDPIAAEVESEDEDAEVHPVLSAGIWAACPRGHGLEVGTLLGLKPPACGICSSATTAEGLCCRECRFCVCHSCRSGGWLSASLLAFPALEAAAPLQQELLIVGFRWLRSGEELPQPLSLSAAVQDGVSACWGRTGATARWGRTGAELEGDVHVELRPIIPGYDGAGRTSMVHGAAGRHAVYAGNHSSAQETRGSIFNLTDQRALSAAVLVAVCGFPGA
mmetsp:Transcript_139256/g.267026  ORF Transcript_139256/g.267026 Transcript_139256/m.267026 type:complete len:419 (-) Transcript_139256:40-1296(-)